MCDLVLIAAILEELGYFDEKKEDKKDDVDDGEERKIIYEIAGKDRNSIRSSIS